MFDTQAEAEATENYHDTYASTVDTVYINMRLDYTSKRFAQNMAKVIEYIANHEGKYVSHCVLGEHRTGAVSMILAAIMGASYDELVEDYMLTCRNLYGFKPGTKQYDLLLDDNLNSILRNIFGIEDNDFRSADLKQLAENFILSAGVTREALGLAKKHLSE